MEPITWILLATAGANLVGNLIGNLSGKKRTEEMQEKGEERMSQAEMYMKQAIEKREKSYQSAMDLISGGVVSRNAPKGYRQFERIMKPPGSRNID